MGLHTLPSDLEEYFEHILSSDIDLGIYRSQIAHMFLVILVAFDTFSWMSYWFIDKLGSELDAKLEIKPMTMQQIKKTVG